ncbi:TonB-dependent receptor [Chryseobacterium sp. T16E-39]|nr:TonB-dependent receptor [Chryseobacterium sp. T16E-39]
MLSVSAIDAQNIEEKKSDTIQSKDIQEVILQFQHKKQFVDKAVYTFDKEALEKARYAKDLLKTLPELQLDPISNTITSTRGQKILFLINSIEASDMQIRSVQPKDVVKVEYFDNPPARWSNRADLVVNIITRNPETGYVFGADLSSAVATGFLNGSAYGNYTKGKNDFGLEYSINYRDYNNRTVKSNYEYNLGNSVYRTEENRKDHFGYTGQNITLRYTRSILQNYTFQAKLITDISTNFVKGNGESRFFKDNLLEDHRMFKNSNSNYTSPTLDLYFSKNIGKKDELTINVLGSHYKTSSSEGAKEWNVLSNAAVYDNEMKLDATQTGIIGEVAHTHTFEEGNLSSGYRFSNTFIANDLNNLSGFSKYDVNYFEQYLYTEFTGKKDKFSYRISAGITNISNKTELNTDTQWVFSPKIILSYALKNNQNFRLVSSYKPQSPSSESLSSNIVQWAPNIVQRGNPNLRSSQKWTNNFVYSLNNKKFDLNANLFYIYNKRAINQYFILDEDAARYALMYENAKSAQQFGLQLSGSYKPFGNSLLVIKAVLTPATETLRTSNGAVIKNNYISNYFSLSSEYKSFNIQYQFNIPVYNLDGAFLRTNENANHVLANYKVKDWTFTTGMYWIGMPSDYKTKSLPESVVNYSRHNQIWNNRSMFILGLSYDFSKGKQIQVNRKLNNNAGPAATF